MHEHPLLNYLMDIETPRTTTLSTITHMPHFFQTDLYNLIFRELNIKDELAMGLRHGNEIFGVGYARDRAFSEREISLLEIIRPHIQIAWKTWKQTRHLHAQLNELKTPAESLQQEQANQYTLNLLNTLTHRQREITELVAEGKENRQIATQLGITPKTVGKHLENIFSQLKIQNRTTLATQWKQAQQTNTVSRPTSSAQ